MSGPARIAVLGGGAWGTALALAARRAGSTVRLWARDVDTVEAIARRHENPRYLPGIRLDPGLEATSDLVAGVRGAEVVLAAVPAQALRGLMREIAPMLSPAQPVVICCKGIERQSGLLMSQVVCEEFPGARVAALSGPSFAADVARGLPTAVTVAAREGRLAAELAVLLSGPQFRCYSSDDLVGVEVAGALKNVLAIAAGAVHGAGLGASAQAALVTRGFVELRRIGAAFGARPETLMGLSGLGDLMLTCGSAQSRNFAYGIALGRGADVAGLPLAEGVATAGIAASLAARHDVEAPIIGAVSAILDGTTTIAEAITALMTRPLRSEFD